MKSSAAYLLLLGIPVLLIAGEMYPERINGSKLPNTETYRISTRAMYQSYPTPEDTASHIYYYYYNANNVSQLDSLKSFDDGEPDMTFYYTYSPTGKVTDMKMGNSEYYGDRGLWYHADYDDQNRISLAFTAAYNDSLSLSQTWLRYHAFYGDDGLNTLYSYSLQAETPYYTRSAFTLNEQGSPITENGQISSDSLSWTDNSITEWTWGAGNTGDTSALVEDRASIGFLNWFRGTWIPDYRPSNVYSNTWGLRTDSNATYTWNSDGNLMEQVNTISGALDERLLCFYDANGCLLYKACYNIYGLDYVWAYTWEQASACDDPSLPDYPTISVSAYPQPFTCNLNLVVKSNDDSPASVEIYNIKGQRLQCFKTPPNRKLVWNGRDEHGKQCSSGIYLIKVKQNNRSFTTRVTCIK